MPKPPTPQALPPPPTYADASHGGLVTPRRKPTAVGGAGMDQTNSSGAAKKLLGE